MNSSLKPFAYAMTAFILCIALWVTVKNQDYSSSPVSIKEKEEKKAERKLSNVLTQAQREKQLKEEKLSQAEQTLKMQRDFSVGSNKPFDPNANRDTQAVAEALKTGKHLERLRMFSTKPFDIKAYKADPKKFLAENPVVPSRCFQSANPGKDVPKLKRKSPYFQRVNKGETIELEVQVIAGAPVTWTAFSNAGYFDNNLISITKIADANGKAKVSFTGTLTKETDILAASPMTSGTARYKIKVQKVKMETK